MVCGIRGSACLHPRLSLDGRVKRRVLNFASAAAMAVPTWLERMMTLMRQTVQPTAIAPQPKAVVKPDLIKTTQASERIFTGPKGGQYVLTASGKKKYLKK